MRRVKRERQEPPTEVKKVPYRIETYEDVDMFGEYSYDMSINQIREDETQFGN